MELITAIVTILISSISWGGIFINNTLINLIEEESHKVEKTHLRVNAVPTHELIKGKADGVQLSLQGWEIIPNLRVELLQLETDEIDLDLNDRSGFDFSILEQDFNMGWRLVLTQEDLNNLIFSEETQSFIKDIAGDRQELEIIDLNLDLLPDNTFKISSKFILGARSPEQINASIQFSLDVENGHKLVIRDVSGTLNDRKLSSRLLQGFVENISEQLSLKILEESGITLRVLKFEVNDNNIEVAGFVNIKEPEKELELEIEAEPKTENENDNQNIDLNQNSNQNPNLEKDQAK